MLRTVLALVLILLPAAASAQVDRRPSHCIAIADAAPGMHYVQPASFRDPVPDFAARITYIDHAMFLIQAEDGTSAVTDYAGFIGPTDYVPDVVTMNQGHTTHWTALPDPAIPHVLEGWERDGVPADHYLDLGGMLVRNVPTDTRSGAGVRVGGNSIFVFEIAGLCIGHLGHLHHEPDEAQYAALGRLDVVMAAVDGGLTLDHPTMIRTLTRLRSSIVIPMHWFGESTLQRFLAGMRDEFAVIETGQPSIEVSLRDLPSRPTVMVLRPAFLRDAAAAE